MLDGGFAQEVIFKGFKFHAVAPLPFHQLVGAGAHRVGGKVVARVQQSLGHNGVAMVAQVVEQHGGGAGSRDAEGLFVHNLNALNAIVIQGDFRAGLGVIQGGFHIFHRHRLAVVIFHALAQLELPHSVADVLIAFHQQRLGVHLHIRIEQSAVGQQIHVRAGRGVVVGGRQRRRLAHGSDDDTVLAAIAGRLVVGRLVGVVAGIRLVVLIAGLVLAAPGEQAEGHGQNQQQAENPQFLALHILSPHFKNSPAGAFALLSNEGIIIEKPAGFNEIF